MKRYCFQILLLLLIHQVSEAQENKKCFNFIVNIDDEIVTTLSRPVILLKQDSNLLKKIDIGYLPGNLSLNTEDFNSFFSIKETTLFLQFYYYQYSIKGKQEVYNYEIEIGKNWFEQSFVILKIYNLDKKKYKNILEPLSKDKNYTFDLETSQGQMIRIRKKIK